MSFEKEDKRLPLQQEDALMEECLRNYFDRCETTIPNELEGKIISRINEARIKNSVKEKYSRAIIIAILLVGIFIASVKWVPGFAVYASNIPIIKLAVDWLQGDSGTEHAKNKGYKEIEGVTIEENGIILKLSNIMFDEDRLLVSATASGERIESILIDVEAINKDLSEESLRSQDFYSPKQIGSPSISVLYKDFENSGGIGQTYYDSEGNISYIDIKYEKIFQKGEALAFLANNPEYITLDVELDWYKYPQEKEVIHIFKNIKIPFDKNSFMYSRHYSINENIPIQQGMLNLDELTISPTRMRVDISSNMEEGYKFNGLEKPYLMDAKGNKYMTEGLISTGDGSNKLSYYIVPSLYFDSSVKELYLGFEEYLVGEDKEIDFTVSLSDELPRSFSYMGEEIIIEAISYRPKANDKLRIDLLIPSVLRNTGGLSIEDHYSSSSSWGSRYTEDGLPTPISFGLDIEERDQYQFKLQYTGYRYPFNKTFRINTN